MNYFSGANTEAAARAWIAERLSEARAIGQYQRRYQLTPAIAKVLIADHMPAEIGQRNRNLKPRHVARLAALIKDGKWDNHNHQGIAISICGVVNDGQHRCHAVVAANEAVEILMTFGQPRWSANTADQYIVPKTQADLIRMAGDFDVSAPSNIAPIAALCMVVERGDVWEGKGRNSVDNWQVLEFTREHHALLQRAFSDADRICRGIGVRVGQSNVGAGLFLILRKQPDDETYEDFVKKLAHGGAPYGDARHTLREEFRRKGGHRFGEKRKNVQERRGFIAAAVVIAWTRWRKKQSTAQTKPLFIESTADFPEVAR